MKSNTCKNISSINILKVAFLMGILLPIVVVMTVEKAMELVKDK